ncbi:MAG: hypothetical protein HOP19_12550 [Acidobacteria bacterium]|nr:hypothetical protein [Acidobacteriota bacterium]
MKRNALSTKHTRRRERGIQLIEVVLVMPLLLLLLAATAEFGRYFYTYAALTRATEISVRYLSSRLLTDGEKATAKALAACGKTACGNSDTRVASGLEPSDVTVTTLLGEGSATRPERVTVSITYNGYQPVFNLANWVGGSWSSLTMTTSTTMRYLLED